MTYLLFACIAEQPTESAPEVYANDPTFGDSGTAKVQGDPTEPGARWGPRGHAAHANLTEALWTGNTSQCNSGDLDAAGRARALELLNTFRAIAGQPEVTADSARNAEAQDCALMMHANSELSHAPPSSWECYTEEGADAAGHSNIATAPAVGAMDMYMQDWGNETTIGHRRWFLSNKLGPVGIGSTNEYSCVYVVGGTGSSGRVWSAWPPQGYFPFEAVTAGGYTSLDENGWSVQSDEINLDNAQVTITEDGIQKPVLTEVLLGGYGSEHAVKITPSGWKSKAGSVYHVHVNGVDTPIDYDVEMVDCDAW